MKPYLLARRGIGYVPDDRRVFADLSVGENLEISERKSSQLALWTKESLYEFFPSLRPLDTRKAGLLSGESSAHHCGALSPTRTSFCWTNQRRALTLIVALEERIWG
jgi:ABC-type branched-subunit amino acid transport system ATPase component